MHYLYFFLCVDSNAQTTLEWSPTQGCIDFSDMDVEVVDNVVPIEDVAQSECVTVCEMTTVEFWINDPNNPLTGVVWSVNGIQEQSTSKVCV